MTYKNKSFMAKKRAFTLIELLIVIAIIGILFVVLVSKVDFATDKAKATGVQTDFRSFQVAFETVAKENAGFNTFGWDTGDSNGNRIRDSYDKGDTNNNGQQDDGEVFVGSKEYGEAWTGIYTLVKPGTDFATVGYDKDVIFALESAINKNLDPKLHITIDAKTGNVTMANQATDPWKVEYHGYYITNAEVDNKDRGAIVMYSNGANQEWGSEHSIANGIVTVNVPGNNIYGKDDYSLVSCYTYINGYGEVKNMTTGFSNNQSFVTNSGSNNMGSNNSNNSGNVGDLNNVPVIGETKQFATLISFSTLKDIYDLSTSPDKEYGYAPIVDNDNTYLCIDYFDDVYDIYYEFYNESEDWWYSFSYATEGIVDLGYAPEVGWYTYDDDGNLVRCAAPYITFTQDMETSMPNGISDLAPLFVEHTHVYNNCCCECGLVIHNMLNGFCKNCGIGPGLYETGTNYNIDSLIYSWQELIDIGVIVNGTVYDNSEYEYWHDDAIDILDGDLLVYYEDGIIPDYAFYQCTNLTGLKFVDVKEIGDYAFGWNSLSYFELNEGVTHIGQEAFKDVRFNCDIRFPSTLTYIGEYAFSDITARRLYINANIQTIENAAFFRPLLDEIHIESWENWFNIDFGASRYSNPMCCGAPIYVNGVLLKDVVIPESVTELKANVLASCSATGTLIFNSHITFDNISVDALKNMYNITNIQFNNVMTYIPSNIFDSYDSLRNLYLPDNIVLVESNAFTHDYDSQGIISVSVISGATIDSNAFGSSTTTITYR